MACLLLDIFNAITDLFISIELVFDLFNAKCLYLILNFLFIVFHFEILTLIADAFKKFKTCKSTLSKCLQL